MKAESYVTAAKKKALLYNTCLEDTPRILTKEPSLGFLVNGRICAQEYQLRVPTPPATRVKNKSEDPNFKPYL